MSIDDTARKSITSKNNVSNRNTINQETTPNLIESEYTMKYMSRIDNLEKDRDKSEKDKVELDSKISELESDIEQLDKDKTGLNEYIRKLEEKVDKTNHENEDLKKQVFSQMLTIKQLEELTKDSKIIAQLRVNIEDKNAEIDSYKEEMKHMQDRYESDVKYLNEQIDILKDNMNDMSEMRRKYEKIKDLLKEHEMMKEKINYYEGVNKEYSKMKVNYTNLLEEKEGLEGLVKELEEKLDENLNSYNRVKEDKPQVENPYRHSIVQKDKYIKDLLDKITEYEYKLNKCGKGIVRGESKDEDQIEYMKSILKLKEDTIKTQEENVASYLEKIQNTEKEIILLKQEQENEMTKKNEEVEYFKKDNNETKDRYEKEFELMASSVYNLGLNYLSMKMDYAQRLNEKPSWLIKERQKYFNGDF